MRKDQFIKDLPSPSGHVLQLSWSTQKMTVDCCDDPSSATIDLGVAANPRENLREELASSGVKGVTDSGLMAPQFSMYQRFTAIPGKLFWKGRIN